MKKNTLRVVVVSAAALAFHLPAVALKRHGLSPEATLIGRLAVDGRGRGQGLGELLLVDALRRALTQSAQIASTTVVVDAIDEPAARLYQHFGFLPFTSRRHRLFPPMKTIAALFPGGARLLR